MKQTVGKIKLRGKIFGINKDKVKDDKKQKKLQLRLQSTKDNSVFLTVNQWKNSMKQAYVSKWDDKAGTYDGKKVPWGERYAYLDDGYMPAGAIKTRKKTDEEEAKLELLKDELKGLNNTDKPKNDDEVKELENKISELESEISELESVINDKKDILNLLPADFIDFILEEYEDGDSVFVMAEATVSEGKENKKYTNYDLTKMYPASEPVDFEADDFEEVNALQFRNLIFSNATDLDEKTAVEFYVFDWKENPITLTTMTYNDDISKHFLKNANFGDTMDVELIAQNKPIYGDAEEETEDSGGIGQSSGQFDGRAIVGNQNELELIFVTNITEEVYTEEEIMTQEDKDDKIVDKAKAKSKKSNAKPWDKK